jgi:hypothetical protein
MPPYKVWMGVIGLPINITLGGYDLTGGTATLYLTSPSGTTTPYSATLLSGNKTVQYNTVGTEFSVVGSWTAEVKVVWGSGKLLWSDQFIIFAQQPSG